MDPGIQQHFSCKTTLLRFLPRVFHLWLISAGYVLNIWLKSLHAFSQNLRTEVVKRKAGFIGKITSLLAVPSTSAFSLAFDSCGIVILVAMSAAFAILPPMWARGAESPLPTP
ncbi:hypothetical protein K438DRAFT_940 [Mycena galopus ATCC 62051]|nr:hypothetical protein K438DRAFT_940 [Mycena galopus ATCC 62051]